MKAKFGAIVVDGRGKIGGHVASKNKAGSYFRTKVTPTNPNTSAQSGVRSSFSSLSQGWRGLTQGQRDSWNSGAVNFPYVDIFGDSKQLSGFGLYMQLNGNLANVGATLLNDCPSPSEISSLTAFEALWDTGTVSVGFTPAIVPVGCTLVVSSTAGLSPGRSFSRSQLRKISTVAAATSEPVNVTTAYVSVFGSLPTTTQNVYFSAFLVNLSTGQVSQALTCKMIDA